jgi:hypothetical protein
MAMVNSFGLWTLSDEVLTFIYEDPGGSGGWRRGAGEVREVSKDFFSRCVVRIPTYER